MRISGFTPLRSGAKLHDPFIESIRSARPLVDEFVIALGDSDEDDGPLGRIPAVTGGQLRIASRIREMLDDPSLPRERNAAAPS